MGEVDWITSLYGEVVGLDTAPLIYFIERHPIFLPLVFPFFEAVERGDIRVVTSTITLSEVLVLPLRENDRKLAKRYEHILHHAEGFTTLPVTSTIARRAAELRSRSRIKTPDALQLSTAIEGGASAFLTNDAKLPNIAGLHSVVLSQISET